MVKSSIFATWRRVAVVCLLALMGTSLAFAGHAGRSQKAEGLWTYIPAPPAIVFEDCIDPDAQRQIFALFENSTWSGTFNGTSIDEGKVVVHCTGWTSFFAIVTFDFVEVDGKVGGLFMRVDGSKPDPTADWCGSWTLIDGTRELANLRGRGNWWGPGFIPVPPFAPGMIYYDGRIKWSRKPLHVVEYKQCQNNLCDDDDDD